MPCRSGHPSTILFVGTIDGISILKSALPLNDWGRACYRNGFREPRMQEPPRSLHVNKIPITAVVEGCGAQGMVTLVPRR
jgi:hypothetical protein